MYAGNFDKRFFFFLINQKKKILYKKWRILITESIIKSKQHKMISKEIFVKFDSLCYPYIFDLWEWISLILVANSLLSATNCFNSFGQSKLVSWGFRNMKNTFHLFWQWQISTNHSSTGRYQLRVLQFNERDHLTKHFHPFTLANLSLSNSQFFESFTSTIARCLDCF